MSYRICNIRTSLTGNYQITSKFCLNLIHSLGGVFLLGPSGSNLSHTKTGGLPIVEMAEFEVYFDKLNQNTEH